jgi:uncharacterized protein (DUF305 family)
MNPLVRPIAAFGTITLATGFAAITALFTFAHANEDSQSVPEICTTIESALTEEAPFLAENEAAMKKMMNDMAVKPTGDVDADFVAMMVPHHQGAIDIRLQYARAYSARPPRSVQKIACTIHFTHGPVSS